MFRYLCVLFCLIMVVVLMSLFDGGAESVSIDAQIVTELMSYPAEDFTENLAYKVLETSTTKITIEKDGQPTSVRLLGIHTLWLLSDRGSTFFVIY